MINENKFNMIWSISKYAYGIIPIIIGIDKYTFFIVDWTIYVSPFVASLISIKYLLPLLGIIEMSAGLLILTKWPRPGAYATAGLLCLVILNLFLCKNYYDIILRDVAIALSYYIFAQLTELKESSQNTSTYTY